MHQVSCHGNYKWCILIWRRGGQEAQSPTQRVVARAPYKREEARQETTSNLKELDSDIICILICQTLCKRQEEKEETCICHHQPQSVCMWWNLWAIFGRKACLLGKVQPNM